MQVEGDGTMNHKAIRVDNLMYHGCEPHLKCVLCGVCVPFHCWTKEQFEQQNCSGESPWKQEAEKGRKDDQ